jgi:hypothetical protein
LPLAAACNGIIVRPLPSRRPLVLLKLIRPCPPWCAAARTITPTGTPRSSVVLLCKTDGQEVRRSTARPGPIKYHFVSKPPRIPAPEVHRSQRWYEDDI